MYNKNDQAMAILSLLHAQEMFTCITKKQGLLALPKTSLWLDLAKESREDIEPNSTIPGEDWELSMNTQRQIFVEEIVANIEQEFAAIWIVGREKARSVTVEALDKIDTRWTKRDATESDENLILNEIKHELVSEGKHIPRILEGARKEAKVVAATDKMNIGWVVVIPQAHQGEPVDMRDLIGHERYEGFQKELEKEGIIRFGTDCSGRILKMIEFKD